MAHEVRAARTWDELIQSMREWQAEQFPFTTAESALKHCEKEIAELQVNAENLGEWVDLFHLTIQGMVKAAEAGLNPSYRKAFPNDLPNLMFDAVKQKLHHNIIERKWQAPDAQGVVEHDRDFPGSDVNPF